jgi:hypothetical protein
MCIALPPPVRRSRSSRRGRRGTKIVWIQEIKERGLRTWLNENPKVGTGIGAGLIGLSLLYIGIYLLRSCNPSSEAPKNAKAWFATEDGQNLYADDALLVPPFQKNNQTFYRAHVFKCPNGQPFVAYVEMFAPDIKQQMEQVKAKDANPLAAFHHFADAGLIKKPGTAKWLPYNLQNQKELSARLAAQRPESKDCAAGDATRVLPPQGK